MHLMLFDNRGTGCVPVEEILFSHSHATLLTTKLSECDILLLFLSLRYFPLKYLQKCGFLFECPGHRLYYCKQFEGQAIRG